MHIYRLTNKINGKFYIGKTIKTLKQRFGGHKAHSNHGSKHYIHNAMRKYGYDNFSMELIESVQDIDSLNTRELYWISELNPEYNMHAGGQGGSIKGRPDLTGNVREAWINNWWKKGNVPWNKGRSDIGGYKHSKARSQEQKNKISDAQKNLRQTCVHCGIITNPGNIAKYHGDNCGMQTIEPIMQKNNTSGVRGVCWCKLTKKWKAKVQMNRKIYRLGTFSDKNDAIRSIEKFRESLIDNMHNYDIISTEETIDDELARR